MNEQERNAVIYPSNSDKHLNRQLHHSNPYSMKWITDSPNHKKDTGIKHLSSDFFTKFDRTTSSISSLSLTPSIILLTLLLLFICLR